MKHSRHTVQGAATLAAAISAAAIAVVAAPACAQNGPLHVPGRVLVQFKPTATAANVWNLVGVAGAKYEGEIAAAHVHVLRLPANVDEAAAVRAIAGRPDVAFAELDEAKRPDAVPSDPGYASQWHLPKISAPTAWDNTTGSSSVVIAVCDTGCDPTHPDLASKYVSGWNFYDNNSDTHDVYGHGTAVAGTAAAAANDGTGGVGVAWNCKIMPCRISDTTGYALYSTAASAITWAADHGARVVNLSYQFTDSSTVSSAAQYFQSKGGVVCISAGNAATFDSTADNPYILTVSATDSNDVLASWSCTGNNIDVSAPGVDIYTTCNGGGYAKWSGTSFSAPIVAGIAALVVSANPNLTGVQAMNIIRQNADDKGAVGWDASYGWGRVNAARSVAAALGTSSNKPPTVATPAASSANPVTGKTVNLSVLGADDAGESNLIYTWSATGPAAVSFSANGTNASKSTTATFAAAGSYTFTATIKDASGMNVTSSVSLAVSQIASSVAVSPGSATALANTSKQFVSSVKDQFGAALSTQPACGWSVSGGGTISPAGLFMAGATPGGPFTVSAAAGLVGTGSVTVTAADITPPTVTITSPTGGSISNNMSVTTNASDNIGVARVELWVDGTLFSTSTSSPWSFTMNTRKWARGSHTLQCKAYDAAGNIGTSSTVTVSK